MKKGYFKGQISISRETCSFKWQTYHFKVENVHFKGNNVHFSDSKRPSNCRLQCYLVWKGWNWLFNELFNEFVCRAMLLYHLKRIVIIIFSNFNSLFFCFSTSADSPCCYIHSYSSIITNIMNYISLNSYNNQVNILKKNNNSCNLLI